MKRTDLLHWLGVPTWVPLLLAIALLLLPALKIHVVQPARLEIQLGGK